MKIRELKAELASHGICAVNILEKAELVRAVHEAREAAAVKRQKKRGDQQQQEEAVFSPSSSRKQDQPPDTYAYAYGNEDYPKKQRSEENDDIASMSVKQLKMELEKCGISPSQFFEKGDMQDALRSAQGINRNEHIPHQHSAGDVTATSNPSKNSNTAPQSSIFPASLSESFGTNKPQPSARTGRSASTPSDSRPTKPRPPARSAKVSDQYSWCSSKEASRDVKSSTSRRSARRHSREETGQPASCCDTHAGNQDGDKKRMPQSFFPINTFDSGTAGGGLMGGSPGAGLGNSVGGDAVFSNSPTDGNADATKNTVTETTFIPASFKKAPVHQNSQWMGSDGKRGGVKRRECARPPAQAPAQQSPSSVANNSFEQSRPEWLQM